MLYEMLSEEALYEALLARDPAHDGRWYVGVRTTGIFCRSTCPARKPLRANCVFLPTIAACLEAGYRPCKRCQPLRPAAEADPVVADLVARLEQDPEKRWHGADIMALGYDLSTVRRSFRRYFGTTFLEMARMMRLRQGFAGLASGERVIDAQIDAGFESGSGFRSAFARLLGVAPGTLKAGALLRADWIDTPLGPMIAVADPRYLHLLEFIDRKALPGELRKLQHASRGDIGIGRHPPTEQITSELEGFFEGRAAIFSTPLKLWGSSFTRSVWDQLRAIPPGETRSYADIARAIGKPAAVRAVARANGANQIAIAIPCHRVIGSDGSLTGYGGGLWRKQQLIELERRFQRQSGLTVSTQASCSSLQRN